MDGSVEYTFDGNNRYQMHFYDALNGESHDYSGRYAINPQMSDYSNVGAFPLMNLEKNRYLCILGVCRVIAF